MDDPKQMFFFFLLINGLTADKESNVCKGKQNKTKQNKTKKPSIFPGGHKKNSKRNESLCARLIKNM